MLLPLCCQVFHSNTVVLRKSDLTVLLLYVDVVTAASGQGVVVPTSSAHRNMD